MYLNKLVEDKCSPTEMLSIVLPGSVFKRPQTISDVMLEATGVDATKMSPDILFSRMRLLMTSSVIFQRIKPRYHPGTLTPQC